MCLCWSGLITISFLWNRYNLFEEKVQLATTAARSIWEKDQAFRRWATKHGGVYVRPDARTPPNPYMAHIPERDVVTTDGTPLTLMNPAYMMSQMIREYEQEYGIKGKITGKLQLNPANRPDAWELKSISAFEQGVNEVIEQTDINDRPFLRLMRPMYMTEGCVRCHGILGFKTGDLRGGVSVSVPLLPYFNAATESLQTIRVSHMITWLFGILGIITFHLFAQRRQQDRLRLMLQLEHDALHDHLTSLPNRLLFQDRLHQAIQRQRRNSDYQFAVCFIDLDRFKNINDSHGHQYGDQILEQVSLRLQQAIRPIDTLARMGGDEFTVLIDGIDDPYDIVIIADRILEQFDQPFNIGNEYLHSNASIGICLSGPQYSEPEQLIRDADIAMYRAKEQGKGRIEFFNKEMHEKAIQLLTLENDIRSALESNQLEVYFQPVINIADNRIDGFEALLRWHHPQLGDIPPDQFIPIAEENGAIIEIGRWVLEQACQQVCIWNNEFTPESPFTISVNFSSRQIILPDIVETIYQALATSGLAPQLLHCEVTETVVIQHKERAALALAKIRELGCETSIDDFGKGYSSLTYLHNFEFDILKIDKEFIQGMGPDGKGRQLVRTIMLLARDFQMQVVAEGVEQLDQLERLQAFGCQWAQGYLFSRPVPASEIETILHQQGHENAYKLINHST